MPAAALANGAQSWFASLVAARLEGARLARDTDVPRVARRAAAVGALAAAGVTGGALAAWLTEGLAAPAGVPLALAAVSLDAGYLALLGIDLTRDLGILDPDTIVEVFAEALGVAPDPAAIGRALVTRALARDVLPIAGLALSAVFSYRTIRHIAAAAERRR
jgi:hypothetical protein